MSKAGSKSSKSTRKTAEAASARAGNFAAGALIVALGGAAAVAGAAVALNRTVPGSALRIAPGVHIGRVAVGGLAEANARDEVRAWARSRQSAPIVLIAPQSHRHWSFTVGDIGGRYDIDPAVAAAARVGQDENGWQRLLHGAQSYPVEIDPEFHFDEHLLDRQLERIAAAVHQPSRVARATYSKTSGVEIVEPERAGIDLDIVKTRENLLQKGSAALAAGTSATLAIHETAPVITQEDLRQVNTLLGSFHTSYGSSSANRRHNIELAAARMNGTLLAPGEEFSYNQIVGPRTTRLGWEDAPTYQDGQVVPGPGGGVCQTSTTLYNAVLRAGLKVVRRSHHSMPVHYVEPGRDATVAYGDIDFRFKNDTPAPVLVMASTTGGQLTFNLYGAAAAHKGDIELESSGHTPTSDGGFVVSTYKILKKADGAVEREKISTDSYAPPPSPKSAAAKQASSKSAKKPTPAERHHKPPRSVVAPTDTPPAAIPSAPPPA